MFCLREELLGIPRADKKKDIDWSRISPSRPALPPAALAPIITKLSTADILALLKAQGETEQSPDGDGNPGLQKSGNIRVCAFINTGPSLLCYSMFSNRNGRRYA